MKNLKFLFAILSFSTIILSGCFDDDNRNPFGCLDADGPISTSTLSMADFTGVKLAMDAHVILTQGDEQSVVVEGKSDIIDELDLDIHNGVWTIKTDRCVRNVDELTFFITIPILREASVTGSGDIRSDNLFVENDVEFNISGSGEIDMAIEADDLDLNISGSGKIKLEGFADEIDASISGSGDIRAFNLPVRVCDINIAGSGDAEVTVSEILDVNIAGSGDVYFKGSPILDVSITGSGDVIDAN